MMEYITYDRDEFHAAIYAATRAGLTFVARDYDDGCNGRKYVIEYTGGF
jgi:hypothetical protein